MAEARTVVVDLAGFLRHMRMLEELAEQYGIDRRGTADWGLILAYRLALKYVPEFLPPQAPPTKRPGRPGWRKSHEYQAALAMSAALAKEKGFSISQMARGIAELEKGKSIKDQGVVQKVKRQIENDASMLSLAHRTLATFVVRNRLNGLSDAEIRLKLDRLAAGDISIEDEHAEIVREFLGARRHK